ncbi:MAG: DUF429 domain-containing protein [Bacteroidia bacterium]|nr:DUF429 domain-containing protein [Bacteroidia bacterium]
MWGGLDLAAISERPSALAIGTTWEQLRVSTLYTDDEIIAALKGMKVIWVDAPLTMGRGAFRDCDQMLRRKGLNTLPLTWRSMQALYHRANRLRQGVAEADWRETFPWSVYVWLGAQRSQKKNPLLLKRWAAQEGFKENLASVHEWDALACWALGWLHLKGLADCMRGEEGVIWVPQIL